MGHSKSGMVSNELTASHYVHPIPSNAKANMSNFSNFLNKLDPFKRYLTIILVASVSVLSALYVYSIRKYCIDLEVCMKSMQDQLNSFSDEIKALPTSGVSMAQIDAEITQKTVSKSEWAHFQRHIQESIDGVTKKMELPKSSIPPLSGLINSEQKIKVRDWIQKIKSKAEHGLDFSALVYQESPFLKTHPTVKKLLTFSKFALPPLHHLITRLDHIVTGCTVTLHTLQNPHLWDKIGLFFKNMIQIKKITDLESYTIGQEALRQLKNGDSLESIRIYLGSSRNPEIIKWCHLVQKKIEFDTVISELEEI